MKQKNSRKEYNINKHLVILCFVALLVGAWYFVAPGHGGLLFREKVSPEDTIAGPITIPPAKGLPKMYLMGGQELPIGTTAYIDGNDVWSSTNGVSWTQLSPNQISSSKWSPRFSFSAVYFRNQFWVMGGQNTTNTNFPVHNDIWNSTNGVTWTHVDTNSVATGIQDAPWSPRGKLEAVVFNNEIWIAGGSTHSNGTFTSVNEVWHSADGKTWIQAPAPSWSARVDHAFIVWNNAMWIIGGDCNTGACNDAWKSTNGTTWTQIFSSTLPQGYGPYTAAILGANLYVNTVDFGAINKSYSSTQGTAWSTISTNVSWGPRFFNNFFEKDGKLWVLAGEDGNGVPRSDVQSSSNGLLWQTVTTGAPWNPRTAAAIVVQ